MSRNLFLGAFLSSLVVLAALISFVWTPYDYAALSIPEKLQPPHAQHWFGTDHFGRDMFSMIMVGARTSIAVALVAVGVGMAVGVPLGLAAAARHGGWRIGQARRPRLGYPRRQRSVRPMRQRLRPWDWDRQGCSTRVRVRAGPNSCQAR